MIDGPVGWIHDPDIDHKCYLPEISGRHFVGSVWRCNECGKSYRVVSRTHRNIASSTELGFEPTEQQEAQ